MTLNGTREQQTPRINEAWLRERGEDGVPALHKSRAVLLTVSEKRLALARRFRESERRSHISI